ncbi:hypothetical protein CRUP_018922 [Coryphaenoides rupestris]|nr:hypothetical protein CRUP_018922 [Coryphaenoides rupestris]
MEAKPSTDEVPVEEPQGTQTKEEAEVPLPATGRKRQPSDASAASSEDEKVPPPAASVLESVAERTEVPADVNHDDDRSSGKLSDEGLGTSEFDKEVEAKEVEPEGGDDKEVYFDEDEGRKKEPSDDLDDLNFLNQKKKKKKPQKGFDNEVEEGVKELKIEGEQPEPIEEDDLDLLLPAKKKLGDTGENDVLDDDEGKNNDGIFFIPSTGPAWAGTERDYTYDELLNRVFNIMREKNPDMEADMNSLLKQREELTKRKEKVIRKRERLAREELEREDEGTPPPGKEGVHGPVDLRKQWKEASSSVALASTAMMIFLSSSVKWLRSGSGMAGAAAVTGGRGPPRGPTEADMFSYNPVLLLLHHLLLLLLLHHLLLLLLLHGASRSGSRTEKPPLAGWLEGGLAGWLAGGRAWLAGWRADRRTDGSPTRITTWWRPADVAAAAAGVLRDGDARLPWRSSSSSSSSAAAVVLLLLPGCLAYVGEPMSPVPVGMVRVI